MTDQQMQQNLQMKQAALLQAMQPPAQIPILTTNRQMQELQMKQMLAMQAQIQAQSQANFRPHMNSVPQPTFINLTSNWPKPTTSNNAGGNH